jgi:hypothetical protein
MKYCMFIKEKEEEIKPNLSTMMQGKLHMVLDQKSNRKSERRRRRRSGLLVKERAEVFSFDLRPCPRTIHYLSP